MLQRNPEFQRHVWTALTPGRLFLMPVILAAVFWVVYLGSDSMSDFWVRLQPTGAIALSILLFFMGLKDATDAIVSELKQQTWDSQRMTAIGPWNMVLGKVFGGPVYAWYGALYCAAAMVIAAWMMPDTAAHLKQLAIIVLAAVFIHATSQCWVLTSIQKNRFQGNLKNTSYIVLILAALILLGIVFQVVRPQLSATTRIDWYLFKPIWTDFVLMSLVYFLICALTGLYRTMRIEFKFKNGPWVWLAFLISFWIYLSGFITAHVLDSLFLRLLARLYIGFGLALILTYITAFNEPKDVVSFRRLVYLLKNRNWKHFQKQVPLFLVTMIIAAFYCILILVAPLFFQATIERPETMPPVWYAPAIFAFLLRDIAMLVYANLRLNAHRADLAVVIYLMMLYILVPLILNLLDFQYLLPAFVPHLQGQVLNGLGFILLQCGFVLFLLYRRWRKAN